MAALVLAVRRLGYRLGTSTVHLLSYLRSLCFRQPSQAASFRVEAEILDRSHGRGLFEPTAAQTNAWVRAGLEAIKIDPKDVDERALKVFWGLRQSEDDPGVSHAQVTQILKAVCELRKEYGITSE